MKFLSASRNCWLAVPCFRVSHFSVWSGRLGQQDRLQLRDDVRGDRDQVLRLAGEEVQLVQRQQPLELRDGIGSVVDPDVDEAVVGAEIAAVLPHDEERGRLHAALVAAAGLARLERGHQPVGQAALGPLERLRQVLHRLVGDHDVGLRAEAAAHDHLPLPPATLPLPARRADPSPGPVEGRSPAEARGVAPRVHDARPGGPGASCRSASRCAAPPRRWRPGRGARAPARRRRCCSGSGSPPRRRRPAPTARCRRRWGTWTAPRRRDRRWRSPRRRCCRCGRASGNARGRESGAGRKGVKRER